MTRRAVLLDLGWPAGEMPSVGELIAHILDRLEYVCAHDVAFRAGAAGEAMGEHDGGASESGSGCSDGSSVDSDAAKQRWHDGVDDMLRAAGLEPATMPGLYAVAHGRAYAGL